MKVLIFSDVHGNLPAFEKMLTHEKDCEQYICLGDLVNYGPWSNECVELALSLENVVLIQGNHEDYFIEGKYPGNNQLVHDFFERSFIHFKHQDSISRFVKESLFENFTCVHTLNDKNIYADTIVELDKNYIIGHSHHQFMIENNSFRLYNTGSVGQNRAFINEINYLIFDTETKVMEQKSTLYDINLLLSKMKEDNYTEQCIAYYANKKRK